MRFKPAILIVFGLIFGAILISLVSAVSCGVGDDNQLIMKLYSSTNSHGALWNDTQYSYEICYNDIFGSDYTGSIPHDCTGNNKVLELYQESNSHAQISNGANNYPYDVCYGDLDCESDYSAENTCTDAAKKVVVRLYQDNNSHISNANDGNYPIKICCKSGGAPQTGSVYWADMSGQPIATAEIGDTVLMIYENTAASTYNFEIWEEDGISELVIDDKIRTIIETFNYNGHLAAKWKITQEDFDKGSSFLDAGTELLDNHEEFYFKVNNIISSLLVVDKDSATDSGANFQPNVTIINPQKDSKHKINTEISFEIDIEDEDDDLMVIWDFGDGTTEEFENIRETGEGDTIHQYNSGGTKIIKVTIREMTRSQEDVEYVRVFVYDENINVFAVISSPLFGHIYGGGLKLIQFNASESYIANCTNDFCASCYNVGDLHCYDLSKEDIPSKYNLLFNWTFSEGAERHGNWEDDYNTTVEFERAFYAPTKHWANLKVGYETA